MRSTTTLRFATGFATEFATEFATSLPLVCHWTRKRPQEDYKLDVGCAEASPFLAPLSPFASPHPPLPFFSLLPRAQNKAGEFRLCGAKCSRLAPQTAKGSSLYYLPKEKKRRGTKKRPIAMMRVRNLGETKPCCFCGHELANQ